MTEQQDIIRRAREALARWQDGPTPGPWKVHQWRYNGDDELDVVVDSPHDYEGVRAIRTDGSYAADSGYMSGADAHLIVGTAGNPALWTAFDHLLRHHEIVRQGSNVTLSTTGRLIESLAAAIVTADEGMKP